MRIRFIHQGGDWPHERLATDSYLDVQTPVVPAVGDTVFLPDDFYRWECEVMRRQWVFTQDRQADVLITLNS